jgi:hypothetical protein
MSGASPQSSERQAGSQWKLARPDEAPPLKHGAPQRIIKPVLSGANPYITLFPAQSRRRRLAIRERIK